MNTNDFSTKRFASFFKWFANISMKKWIKILVSISLGTFIFVMIISPGKPLADNSIYEAIFLIGAGVIASMVLSDINKPTIRQQFISIPATRFEKYYTVLSITIIRTIGLLLALCIADFFKTMIQCFQGEEFKMAIAVFDETMISTTLYFAGVVLYWSLNYISGITVRKYPFLYGFVIGGYFFGTVIVMAVKKLQQGINVDTEWNVKTLFFEYPVITIVIASIMLYGILLFGGYGINKIQLSSKFNQNFVKQ
ncbi:MAG: hypothetical protein PUC50_02350 [Bacteroidales bacterium]|nr:hypothetical protein [Bacteroidales bacterium]